MSINYIKNNIFMCKNVENDLKCSVTICINQMEDHGFLNHSSWFHW